MEILTDKQMNILFDLWYERFDYNEETADAYNELKNQGLTNREVLNELFGYKQGNRD